MSSKVKQLNLFFILLVTRLITASTQVNCSLLSHLWGVSGVIYFSHSTHLNNLLSLFADAPFSGSLSYLSFQPSLQAEKHFCTSFPSVLLLFPSPLNYDSHQRKQRKSKYFWKAEKWGSSAFADDVLEMPEGAKRANTLKSTLRDITVKTDVPPHLKNPSAILKSREFLNV